MSGSLKARINGELVVVGRPGPPGNPGANGTDGADGTNGADGTDGTDGRGIVSVVRTSGTGAPGTTDTYTITFTDATTSTFNVYNGANGAGSGDVVGPASSTDLRIAVFSGTTGKLLSVGGNTIGGVLSRANHTGTQAATTITGLATVATTGAYSNLTGTPTLGTAAAANTGTGASQIPILSGTPGTASSTTFLRGDGTWATPAGGSGGGILTSAQRTATAVSNYSTTSTTPADVDATNLAVTFIAPASGSVVVTLSGATELSASGQYYWSLRAGTTNIAGSERLIRKDTAAANGTVTSSVRMDGLTPGVSVTWKWAHRIGAAGPTARLNYGGTSSEFSGSSNFGPATMEIWSA